MQSQQFVQKEHRDDPKQVPQDARFWFNGTTKMGREYEQNAGPNEERDGDHGAGVNEEIQHKALAKAGTQIGIFLAKIIYFVQIEELQHAGLHGANDLEEVAAKR